MSYIVKIQNEKVIPDTHFFVQKDKKYPFKFDFFKYASNYFSKNEYELSKNKNIQLIDCDQQITILETTINDFINHAQCQQIKIQRENVIELNYLSK